MDLEVALRESIVKICGVSADDIRPTSTLDELGIDSLAAAELITDLESRMRKTCRWTCSAGSTRAPPSVETRQSFAPRSTSHVPLRHDRRRAAQGRWHITGGDQTSLRPLG